MSDIKSSDALKSLQDFLTKLFQFESADLDFGIYKILHYKKAEVEFFLNTLLVEQVQSQLNLFVAKDKEALENEFKQLSNNSIINNWKKALANINEPDNATKVTFYEKDFKEDIDRYIYLETLFAHQQSVKDAEPLIYNHLTIFFSRYYDKGDFISKRRYGKSEKYVVPYNGEETYFHWANADQYYIKSSELFRKYSFRVPAPNGYCNVHFKLRDATEENGNSKSENNKFFVVAENPVEATENEVNIFFEYRALANAEKESKGKNQDELNTYALPIIAKALNKHTVLAELNKTPQSPSGDLGVKTKLALELNRYTARNKYDFFIHKDLKGFLNRELDFYIKSELLKLDDLTVFDTVTHYEKIKLQFNIVKTFKSIASTIIDFISQVEDFQKKLWEKKKFVICTEYVITLDKLAAFTSAEFTDEILAEVLKNEKQLDEWKKLFGEEVLSKWEKLKPADVKNEDSNYKKLPIDTAHFSAELKWKLLCKISEQNIFDDVSNGLVVKSDNYQALNLIEEKFYEKIKCAYYDPPYNTGGSEFNYKNEYRHSSWCSMIKDRLDKTVSLITDDGASIVAIDDFEFKNLTEVIEQSFGSENYLGNLVVEIKPSGRTNDNFLATSHEYCLYYAKEKEKVSINFFELTEEQKKQYKHSNGEVQFKWRDFLRTGGYSTPQERPNSYYPIFYNQLSQEISLDELPNTIKILPIDSNGKHRVWRKTPTSFLKHLKVGEMQVVENSDGNFKVQIIDKIKSGLRPKSVWTGAKYDASSHGSKLIKAMFNDPPFSYPKSVFATMDSLHLIIDEADTVIDIFGGSGTTAHAIQLLNNKDEGERKFILIEQNNYFYTVIIPRIKKVAFSFEWDEGKPQSQNGLGVLFKYQRLEQYEESLENIAFTSANDTAQTQLQFKDYIPKYFLHFETAGSKPFMNLDAFQNPFGYSLKVFDNYNYIEQTVDVVETFNYLIGLHLHGYQKLEHQKRDYLFVKGTDRQNRRIAIVWRDATGLDFENDRDFIRQTLKGSSYDVLYANNQCAIEGAIMIEEVFSNRMS